MRSRWRCLRNPRDAINASTLLPDQQGFAFCFERAIAKSREQGARLFELNAARDLARLSTKTGDGAEALQTLRAMVDWFPATLDVPILAECRALVG
jgi:hypothetical protein